jgi:hypothetical protein
MTISNSSSSGKAQKDHSRVRILILVMSIFGIVALCLCGWAASSVWRSFQPKTDSAYYPDASITEMITLCEMKSRYSEPQDWMDVTGGEDRVLMFSYSHSIPFPDSFTGYSLYLQLPPGDLLQGQEYDLREDLQSILVTTCGYPPEICCTQDINGSIQILDITDQAVKASLTLDAQISQTNWEYSGEVIFDTSSK